MARHEQRTAVVEMSKAGMSIREIGRKLNISRNTVRNILRGNAPQPKQSPFLEHLTRIRELCRRTRGNLVRVHELLGDEGIQIGYTTLTKLVREHNLRDAPIKRAGFYEFLPGEEMQFDTSPHTITLDGRRGLAHCATLVLGYSRKLYVQYYPVFSRFEARAFLTKALAFMGGSCKRCVIDNTSVVVIAGSGETAVFSPEMEAFGRHYGFTFTAHALRHADRKGKVERPFAYIERNFLAAREFSSWEDINNQVLAWCLNTSNPKTKRVLGMSPDAAHIIELPFLLLPPAYIPPVYESAVRIVDTQGFIYLETNRYSVPDKLIGKTVEVQKHLDSVRVYFKNEMVAEHRRLVGTREKRVTLPGHHAPLARKGGSGPRREEKLLLGQTETLDRYVDLLRKKSPGRGTRKLQRLLELRRTYPTNAFQTAVATALVYAMTDLARLESMILNHVAGDFFQLDEEE
jgi:transposase